MWKPEHRRAAERHGVRYPSDLTDAEWALVAPLIPPARRRRRPPRGPLHRMTKCRRRPTKRNRSAKTAKEKALSKRGRRSFGVKGVAGPASSGDEAGDAFQADRLDVLANVVQDAVPIIQNP
jgi:hypothetical protein